MNPRRAVAILPTRVYRRPIAAPIPHPCHSVNSVVILRETGCFYLEEVKQQSPGLAAPQRGRPTLGAMPLRRPTRKGLHRKEHYQRARSFGEPWGSGFASVPLNGMNGIYRSDGCRRCATLSGLAWRGCLPKAGRPPWGAASLGLCCIAPLGHRGQNKVAVGAV
jgi:hypothetical protein